MSHAEEEEEGVDRGNKDNVRNFVRHARLTSPIIACVLFPSRDIFDLSSSPIVSRDLARSIAVRADVSAFSPARRLVHLRYVL